MLTIPECLPCFLGDVESAARLLFPDDADLRWRIVTEATQFLANEVSRDRVPSYYITRVHRILKRLSGLEMPFADLRRRANEVGLAIAESLTPPPLNQPFARFQFLVRWAITGNYLDFRTVGTGYGLTTAAIRATLEEKAGVGLHVDQTREIFAVVQAADTILYCLDNVGEIAFDRLLIAELQRYARVTAAVKGGPITSDAVLADAQAVGLTEVCPVIVAGPDTLGISLEEETEEMRQAMASADLIITKGQANFYVMEEYARQASNRIACLFSTKCDPIATKFGLRGKVDVAVLMH
ncbi:MAG: hypothetical protein DRI80_11185 [Chloroflexota bacterium]|nr:MAG: hypothetical protein DRI80_11185 [Chloroflexota bacterium]